MGQAIRQNLQNRYISKNTSTKIFDYSMGRAEIAQEMEQAETNLLRFKIKVKDRNDKEEREAIELEEKLRNPKGAKAKKVYELNLDPDYWRARHIYPYALEPVPLKQPG